jgi:ferredoxin
MTVTRGDEHVFLGMKIYYDKTKRTAGISMKEYLREAIEESGMEIETTCRYTSKQRAL